MMSIFNRIRILDATMFQLPDTFATDYQGSGGSSNTAGVKIQLEYDLLSGQFLNVQLGPERTMIKHTVPFVLKPLRKETYVCVISVTSI